jgi:hypothetical protein
MGGTTVYGSRAITVDTGGVLNIVLASSAGDDFTVDTTRLVVSGDETAVGINTATPVSLLDVRGPTGTGAAPAGLLTLATNELTVVDGDQLGRVEFRSPIATAGTDAIVSAASIWAEANATFSASVNSADIVFATATSGAATEKMRILSSGRVGIGSAAPDHLFEVGGAGNTRIQSLEAATTGTGYLYAAVVNTGGQFYYGVDSNVGGTVFSGALAYSSFLGSNNATALHLGTSGATRMTVAAGGNVGIGTAAPVSPLTVIGITKLSRADATPAGTAQTVYDDCVLGSTDTANTGMTIFGTGQVGIAFGDAGANSAGQIRYQHPTDKMEFMVNASVLAMAIDYVGNVQFSAGLLIGGTAAANTLDDYEEGSWTPTILGATSTSGQSYSVQTGTYSRVGRLVHVTAEVVLAAKGTIGGFLKLSGLPFTPEGTFTFIKAPTAIKNANITDGHEFELLQYASNTFLYFYETDISAAESFSQIATAGITDDTGLYLSLAYTTAA